MISKDIDGNRIIGLDNLFEHFPRDYSFMGFYLKGFILDGKDKLRLTYSNTIIDDKGDERTFSIVFFLNECTDTYDIHGSTGYKAIENLDISTDKSGNFIFSEKTNNIYIKCKEIRVETHDILSERFAKDKAVELTNKYSEILKEKIKALDSLKFDDDELVFRPDNSYNGIKADRHMMYKLPELHNEDGSIYYEFLIELDIKDPSIGIYYGCKGLIKKGDNDRQIQKMNDEWEKPIQEKVLERLNTLFINKKYQYRFKPTDNANDNTYWPFWISLHPDENILEVAARATIIIRDEYKRYLEGARYQADRISRYTIHNVAVNKKVEVHSETRFTTESWESLKKPWSDESNTDNKKKIRDEIEIAERRWPELLTRFINGCIREKLIEENNDIYEKAFVWIYEDMNSFAFMMRLLIKRLIDTFTAEDNVKKKVGKEIDFYKEWKAKSEEEREQFILREAESISRKAEKNLNKQNMKKEDLRRGPIRLPWEKISKSFLLQKKGQLITSNADKLKNLPKPKGKHKENIIGLFHRIMS